MPGFQLDYVREGFKQMFAVKNPNVGATCGCGESFSIAADDQPAVAT